MEKIKRSYFIPAKLSKVFDEEAVKQGFVKEKVIAAAVLHFIDGDPNSRSKMFDRLDGFVRSKKGS